MLLVTATETAQKLAQKPPAALRAVKRLMKWSTRQDVEDAIRAEIEEFTSRIRSAEVREAIRVFLESGQADLRRTTETTRAEKVS
jgi:enoyl-CoA hydratase/carnithine racemase